MKDPEKVQFLEAREETLENIDLLKETLETCVDAGMLDPGEAFHNQLLDLVDETVIAKGYPELAEVISQARTIETDLEGWLASRGSSTIGLSWPKIK